MNKDISCCIVKVEPDGDVHTGRVPGHHLDRKRCFCQEPAMQEAEHVLQTAYNLNFGPACSIDLEACLPYEAVFSRSDLGDSTGVCRGSNLRFSASALVRIHS